MRIHIIQSTHFTAPSRNELFKARKRELVPLTLPYLAGLIPEGHEVRITDEQVQNWDPEAPSDCVFISVQILNSLRAYEIADAYRRNSWKRVSAECTGRSIPCVPCSCASLFRSPGLRSPPGS